MQPQSPLRLVDLLGLCILREKSDLTTPCKELKISRICFSADGFCYQAVRHTGSLPPENGANTFKSILSEVVLRLNIILWGEKALFFFFCPVSVD